MNAVEEIFHPEGAEMTQIPAISYIREFLIGNPESWTAIQQRLTSRKVWEAVLARIPKSEVQKGYVREFVHSLLYLPNTAITTGEILAVSADPILQGFINADSFYMYNLRVLVKEDDEDPLSIDSSIVSQRLIEIQEGKRNPSSDLLYHMRSQYTPEQIEQIQHIIDRLKIRVLSNSELDDRRKPIALEAFTAFRNSIITFFAAPLLYNEGTNGSYNPIQGARGAINIMRSNVFAGALGGFDAISIILHNLYGPLSQSLSEIQKIQCTKKENSDAYNTEFLRADVYRIFGEIEEILDALPHYEARPKYPIQSVLPPNQTHNA